MSGEGEAAGDVLTARSSPAQSKERGQERSGARRQVPQLRRGGGRRVLLLVRPASAPASQPRHARPRHPARRVPLRRQDVAHDSRAVLPSRPAHAPLHRRRARQVRLADGAVPVHRVPDVRRVLVHDEQHFDRRKDSVAGDVVEQWKENNQSAKERTERRWSVREELKEEDLFAQKRVEIDEKLRAAVGAGRDGRAGERRWAALQTSRRTSGRSRRWSERGRAERVNRRQRHRRQHRLAGAAEAAGARREGAEGQSEPRRSTSSRSRATSIPGR